MAFIGVAEFFATAYQYKENFKQERMTFLKKRKEGLLVEKELKAFGYLSACIKDTMFICPQVHLLQIFDFDNDELLRLAKTVVDMPATTQENDIEGQEDKQQRLTTETNKERGIRLVRDSWTKFGIGDKSVDFLICHKESFEILFAIEIDGDSHGLEDEGASSPEVERQKKWDLVKTKLFNAAKIPLLRIKNSDIEKLDPDVSQGLEDAKALFVNSVKIWRGGEK